MDLKINDTDLRIDVFRSGGPGGQSKYHRQCCTYNIYLRDCLYLTG